MSYVVFFRVGLLHQNLVLASVPNACPILVSPAETKRKVRLARHKHLIERSIQKAFACEPIVVVAEAGDSILPRQLGLSFTGFRNAKIVKPEIGGQVWLVVAAKKRTRFSDVRPLGKSFTPPCIILGYRMILRQVKGDNARIHSGSEYYAGIA